jgi:hypothetical protein
VTRKIARYIFAISDLIREYLQARRCRIAEVRQQQEMLWEARQILNALNGPGVEDTPELVRGIMMEIGLVALRTTKERYDQAQAAQAIEGRIKTGPRPSAQEAVLN